MLANTFHWTLTQYINFALKLSGQPFIVREVKEGFRAYPTVDAIMEISMLKSTHNMATQDAPW